MSPDPAGGVMKAICRDGVVVHCRGFKTVDTGVVLTADADREEVIGFLPNERLAYLLPDEVAERERAAGRLAGADGEPPAVEALRAELGERIDALERRIEATTGDGGTTAGSGHGVDADGGADADVARSVPLEAVRGLGPASRERLRQAGVASAGDLAARAPVDVAATAGVTRRRARRWVRRAAAADG